MLKKWNLPSYNITVLRRIQNEVSPSAEAAHEVTHDNRIQYLIRIGEQDHLLNLQKAHDLLTTNFTASHYTEDGTLVTESPSHLAHCCYTGTLDGVAESFVSLCTCHGLSGYITLADEVYSIEALSEAASVENIAAMLRNRRYSVSERHRHQKRSLQDTNSKEQEETYNIELFLVADKKEFQRHGENLEKTRHHLIAVAHHLNQIFLKINFQIFLVGIEIWTQENKANVSITASSTLLHFLEWRSKHLLPRKHHDNIQLISGMRFRNHALGEAFVAKMCSTSQSGGIIKDTGLSPRELAKYVAHEMGHNLGMNHDSDTCYCPVVSGRCLLSRHTGYSLNDAFSDCSYRFLSRFLHEKDISCLRDRPHTYIHEIVEHSEPHKTLEAVGKASVFLCPLIILLLLGIICRSAFQKSSFESVGKKRKKLKMTFSPVRSWEGQPSVAI